MKTVDNNSRTIVRHLFGIFVRKLIFTSVQMSNCTYVRTKGFLMIHSAFVYRLEKQNWIVEVIFSYVVKFSRYKPGSFD